MNEEDESKGLLLQLDLLRESLSNREMTEAESGET